MEEIYNSVQEILVSNYSNMRLSENEGLDCGSEREFSGGNTRELWIQNMLHGL